MKVCAKCRQEKPFSEFATKVKEKGWLQPYCRECQKEYRREHYLRNRSKYIQKAKSWIDKEREKVQQIKSVPCKDCGILYPPYVMEFDHLFNNKKFTIGPKIGHLSMETIANEITKCDIVCSNCHKIRTHDRKINKANVIQG